MIVEPFVYCPECGRESPAELPPCPDGHGGACPDLACADCAAALVSDVLILRPRTARTHRRAA